MSVVSEASTNSSSKQWLNSAKPDISKQKHHEWPPQRIQKRKQHARPDLHPTTGCKKMIGRSSEYHSLNGLGQSILWFCGQKPSLEDRDRSQSSWEIGDSDEGMKK